jgi:hypothetical protein
MRVIAIVAATAALLVGCSGGGDDSASSTPPANQPSTTAPATVEVPAPTTQAEDKPGLAAADVVAAFKTAKLPVTHARDNSRNCEGLQLGCLEMITTDDITVTTWADSPSMEAYAHGFGTEAFVAWNVVLQYAAARTPAKLRPRYQQVLTKLAG